MLSERAGIIAHTALRISKKESPLMQFFSTYAL